MLRPAEPSAHPSPVSPTSEARHTPGPWTIDGHSRQGETRIVAPFKPTCTYQVALVSPDVPDDATRDANARLIAAAPDLLAAAEAALPLLLLAAIKAPDRECAKRYSETCGVLTAAIKAAKGGVA